MNKSHNPEGNGKELEGVEILPLVEVDTDPLHSLLTKTAAILFGLGVGTPTKKAFLDATERKGEETFERTVRWAFRNQDVVTFRPMAKVERLTPGEIVEKINDEEWVEANPDHPLAMISRVMRELHEIEAKISGDHECPLPRHLAIRRGARVAYIPADYTEEQQDKALADLEFYK